MNKKMQTLMAKAIADTTDAEAKDELKELGVRKFRQVYGRVQEAVKTVNRHLAPGKGHPNRATLATAIGLRDELYNYENVAALLGMQEMTEAVKTLAGIVESLKQMRKTGVYGHIDYLPDFLTETEKQSATEEDLKMYLYNITNAVNAAADNIAKHFLAADYDPNTYTVAKAIGYKGEEVSLGEDFETLAKATGKDFSAEIKQTQALATAIAAIDDCRDSGYVTVVSKVPEYDPFPEADDDDDGEETDGGDGDNIAKHFLAEDYDPNTYTVVKGDYEE